MFEVVTTSSRARRRLNRPATLAGSIAIHAAVGIVIALLPRSGPRTPAPKAEEQVTYFDVPVAHVPAAGAKGGAGTGTASAPTEKTVVPTRQEVLVPPVKVPDHIPEAAPATALSLAGNGLGSMRRDTLDTDALAIAADEARRERMSDGDAVNYWELPELPRLSNPRTMAMIWSELYPARLLDRGIEGQALVSFVINTDGRVDPATLAVVSTTHPEFGRATLMGARRLRFRPAFLGGHPVRVRAMMPVSWVLPQS